MISDNCLDGTCQLIEEFLKMQKELMNRKKAQTDLAETVLINIQEIQDSQEKVKILQILRKETLEEKNISHQQKTELINRVQAEVERLEAEIHQLVGVDPDAEGWHISDLVEDLDKAGNNRVDALRCLSKRYQVDLNDKDMQADLIRFVSGIERAARLYDTLLKMIEIADDIRDTEEKIEYLLEKNLKKYPRNKLDASEESKPKDSTTHFWQKAKTWLFR